MPTNAGYLKRFLAQLIDVVLSFLIDILAILVILTLLPKSFDLTNLINAITAVIFVIVVLIYLNLYYVVYTTSRFGGPLGKLLMGLKVVDYDSDQNISQKLAFFRTTIGYAFSGTFLGLGYFKIISHPQKLAWHDELFGTKVIQHESSMWGILTLLFLTPALFGAVILLVVKIAALFS
jgi:uncharacterized RDD family membrane protein YckC